MRKRQRAVLDMLEEGGRRHHPVLGVLPARQDLGPDDPVIDQGYLGLVVGNDLSRLHCVGELVAEQRGEGAVLAGNELMVARVVRLEGPVQAVGGDGLGQDGDQFELAAGNDFPHRRQQAAVEAAHHANIQFAAEGFLDGIQ
ncbi:hypothetical protein SDC9_198921 [bioreactor metagenome]|uniref:Uncharacterized protein n=1 Tax=bioreactor metagenome TaxID=1076179 RepID=A0A645IJ11_9ZZZZ